MKCYPSGGPGVEADTGVKRSGMGGVWLCVGRPLTLPLSLEGRGDDGPRGCRRENPRPYGERVAGRPVRGSPLTAG